VFFVLVGLLLLADRYGFFTIGWEELWRFWPLVLVFIGAAILLRGSKYRWGALALGGVLLALIIVSVLSFSWVGGDWTLRRDVREQSFSIPFRDSVRNASLTYEGGAGALEVREGSGQLFDATTHASFGEYTFEYDSSGNTDEIHVYFEGQRRHWRLGRLDNYAIVTLHAKPVWALDLNLGAAKIDLDLERLAVERLRLKTGAATAKIKLGALAKQADVDVEAGASSVRIDVPESVGCEIRVEAPLSSKRFPDFKKVGDGEYQTENYYSAEKKISIAVRAGVSSVRVSRY
jgi:hypothetical protein